MKRTWHYTPHFIFLLQNLLIYASEFSSIQLIQIVVEHSQLSYHAYTIATYGRFSTQERVRHGEDTVL